jgi:hypothetical protein
MLKMRTVGDGLAAAWRQVQPLFSSGDKERSNLPVMQQDWNDMARGATCKRNQESQA